MSIDNGCATVTDGLFRYAPLLMLPNLFIQLVTIFFLYDSTVKVLILQRVFLWTALLLLYIEIYYLFINWVFSMKDYIRVFNEAHRLLGRRRSNRLSAVDMLPFLTTYGYVLKPIVLPGNFVDWPSLNLLLYVRLFAQLSVESVAFAAMRAAEVVLRDLNRDLGLGNISLQEVAATWFRVNEFVKGVSRTIGTLYFPVVLMTVFLVIAGNLAALKPIMSNGIDKRVGMYVIEWSGPLCSIFVVCRRSQAVFVQVKASLKCNLNFIYL